MLMLMSVVSVHCQEDAHERKTVMYTNKENKEERKTAWSIDQSLSWQIDVFPLRVTFYVRYM